MAQAQKIQIDAGHNQSITALLYVPEDRSTTRVDQTLVLMCHSFPGHKSYHNDIFGDVEFLLGGRGYHTLRFDLRGCGESDGKEEHFTIGGANEDFQAVLYWAKTKGYKHFIFVGEGLGATLSVMNMDLDVRALILCWPVMDLDLYRKAALQISHVSEDELKQGFVSKNDRRIGVNFLKELKKIDIEYALKEVFVPTLILHGARDKNILIEQLDIARRFIPAKRIEITSFHDGEHGLTQSNHRKSMMFQIQQFVEKYV